MKVRRFGVSLEEDLLKELDTLVRTHKLPNRSQAIRFLIRNNVVAQKWKHNITWKSGCFSAHRKMGSFSSNARHEGRV